jgi:hypothetical protein
MHIIRLLGYSAQDGKKTRVTMKFDDAGKLLNPRALAWSSMVGWGKIQFSKKVPCNSGSCWWVSTPGHGGYIVVSQTPLEWAKDPSIKVEHGIFRVYVYEFEEDCDWAILEYNDPRVLHASVIYHERKRTADQWRDEVIIPCLERYNSWVLEKTTVNIG